MSWKQKFSAQKGFEKVLKYNKDVNCIFPNEGLMRLILGCKICVTNIPVWWPINQKLLYDNGDIGS